MTRRVTIQTPMGEALQFRKLVGREALSRLYAFDVELLSNSNGIDPKALLGRPATVAMQTESGGTRYLSGIASFFGLGEEDARQSFYRMTLRPWLWLATLRSDFRIFQNKSVPDILTEVLGGYGYAMEQRLSREYRAWDYCVQYHESDFSYVSRLCELEGIGYYFRHEEHRHVLVFADDIAASHEPLPGGGTVRFHPSETSGMTSGSRASPGERIYEWKSGEEMRSGFHFTDDYDFLKPSADLSGQRQAPAGHTHDYFERYEWPGGYKQHEDGEVYTRIRTEEQHSERCLASGRSNKRELAPGHVFELANHPRQDQNRKYLLTSVEYELQENMQASEGAGEGSVQRFAFEAQPADHAWRPRRVTLKPRTRGPQTAIVVGPKNEETWTDRHGRVKVEFHWDRLGARNENSSCWVRVSMGWAGDTFGTAALPRVGHEVVVDFLNGDPDCPIITGRVFNAANMPAWRLPEQANLSGMRSRELNANDGPGHAGGSRGNHLVLDDHPGKIQAQLKSDHLCSSLSLGHIGRIDGTEGRTDDRGEGAELRTDGHASVRAAKGLLLTTEARPGAQAHITDIGETVARLTAARDLHERQSQTAQEAMAHEAGDQDAVTAALKAQNDAIKGGAAEHGAFAELGEPHLVLASAAGIQSTAAGATHIASITHNALSSGGHTSISAGRSFLVSVRDAARLFAYKAIRLTAATAGIDIVALQNSINLLAKLDIKLEAHRISITAKEEIVLNGGGSFTKWNATGIVHGTRGIWREHARTHSYAGPMDMAKLLRMESVSHDDKYSVRFAPLGSDAVFKHMDMTGLPYRILDEQQGTRAEGVIPEDGRLPRIEFDTPDEAVLVVGEESWNWSEVPTVRTREDDDSDAPEATDGDGPQDEPADSEDSKYARQGGSAGAGQFLAESAVQAYLNALA
ncbi:MULTISPECIES: type VI secretion system Vgr family protein [Variovorax]|jgi:type VI secretion system secreted protein VgrG|uniref:type VI secretion system Vgr family protein n=1 Tax=Variovorax TaxID=34072 RepID=UPI000868A3A0|nr:MULTISPECIES: type VI secretion system Vgr family protein [Variovorax]MBN8756755.1 type VI secretion system tip protein VgrG [Variovorax sp.]ODU15633.1 MAG: type VI secretion protein Vgr [Variovorax sp. SCN 67-85]ODV20158.1 MAG: type VI secretion protein Vgr [Variovorax sp. SCN 67-20]OJZ11685.1 MAG: type VI secretion protein Vgr [Variovorax sp. 67-131]UKI05767.1 type VI secretion system tip protein VgrG [Variovorax paradoxus]